MAIDKTKKDKLTDSRKEENQAGEQGEG